jgi:hypothetical protein
LDYLVKDTQLKICWKGNFSEQVITGVRIIVEETAETNYSDLIFYCGNENMLPDSDFSKMRCALIFGEQDRLQMFDRDLGDYIAISDTNEY